MVALVVVWVAGATMILGLLQVAIRWVAAGDDSPGPVSSVLALAQQRTGAPEELAALAGLDALEIAAPVATEPAGAGSL